MPWNLAVMADVILGKPPMIAKVNATAISAYSIATAPSSAINNFLAKQINSFIAKILHCPKECRKLQVT
jgi:hypothetical protein